MNAVPRGPSYGWSQRQRLALFVLFLLTVLVPLRAQNPLADTAVPRRPIYGIGLDEFWIAGVKATRPHNTTPDSLWNFAHELNMSTWEIRNGQLSEIDAMRDAAKASLHQRLMLDNEPMKIAAYGREATFYPFDSADNYYCRNVFVHHTAGTKAYNVAMVDTLNHVPQERIYGPGEGTVANQVVASRIAFNYDSTFQIERYPTSDRDPQFEDSHLIFNNPVSWLNSNKYAIEIAAHLFDPLTDGGGGAVDTDTLLFIDIWNEVPKGSRYRVSTAQTAPYTAAIDTEFIYATIGFTRAQIKPLPPLPGHQPEYGKYHIVAIPLIDFDTFNGRCGPHHPDNTAHRIDIRVRWGGLEKVALRRVTLRDSCGQLANGYDAASIAYRQSVIDNAQRLIFGAAGTADSSRVIRFYGGDEGMLLEHTGFLTLDTLLARAFPFGDAITKGVRAYRADAYHNNHATHTIDDQGEITVETYPKDLTNATVSDAMPYYGIPDLQPGAIAKHNGGKFHVPLIDTTTASVTSYERALQRVYVGAASDRPKPWPYTGSWAESLHDGAWGSRRTGKRLMHWIGVHAALNIYWAYDTANAHWYRDPLLAHIPEPAEMRMLANLGLCNGSRGVEYSWMGTTLDDVGEQTTMYGDPAGGSLTHSPYWPGNLRPYYFYADVGPVGNYDSVRTNFYTMLPLTSDHTFPDYFGVLDHMYDTLRNFWTGWGVRTDELKWLGNKWLPRIGAAMAKLQWRDSYSTHFFKQQAWLPYDISGQYFEHQRALPGDEIVKKITTRSLDGAIDSSEETYVELGFFDRQHESDTIAGQVVSKDVNYIYICNRRSFERPTDVDSLSKEGRWMDAHAENRIISLKLNLAVHDGFPAPDHYNFVHITQVIDSVPLAGYNQVMPALDTLMDRDSTIEIALRPGGGTLLRIAYCPPELAIGPGNLERNGQRKILFDGTRYYACWTAPKKCRFPLSKPFNQQHAATEDAVYFRRSYPATDTTGAIQWEPKEREYVVSDTTDESRFRDNRYPSMTFRRLNSDSTVVTVVWTGYNADSVAPGHSVYLRNILSTSNASTPLKFSAFERPGFSHGTSDSAFGNPVVSRLHGGYMIAWSDALYGIMARFRTLPSVWNGTGVYSARTDSVSRWIAPRFQFPVRIAPGIGQFPSMPPFTDLGAADSNVGLVWQQPLFNGGVAMIFYARVIDSLAPGGHMPVSRNFRILSTESLDGAYNPSIDQSLDVWHRIQEGVVWDEPRIHQYSDGKKMDAVINFRSLWTANGNHPGLHDSLGQTYLWGLAKAVVRDGPWDDPKWKQFTYPSTTALNQVLDTAHMNDSLFFSTVGIGGPAANLIRTSSIRYSSIAFARDRSRVYAFGGTAANGAASDTRIDQRFAALYQAPRIPDTSRFTTMHTTRQFYGKTRPGGYIAEGRQGVIRLSDTAFAVAGVELYDVWKADPAEAAGIANGPLLEATPWSIDSLNGLRSLMRSATFTAHDSTTIGCNLYGKFNGDTTGRSGLRLTVVAELVDAGSSGRTWTLDSFVVTPISGAYSAAIAKDFDLLSGTYYVRLRIDTLGMPVDMLQYYTNYTVASLTGDVDEVISKVRRMNGTASQGRITAQPNPVAGATQVLFSVPAACRTSVIIYDGMGHEVRRLVDETMMDAGRYAIDFETEDLAPGNYMIQFLYGTKRAVSKIVVIR